MKSCVCGFSSPKYTTLIAHKKFCMGKMVIHNNREDFNKTEVFADTTIINPPRTSATLTRLCSNQGINVEELSRCLQKKADLLAAGRKKIPKPGRVDKITDFRKSLNKDIKAVGPDGDVELLVDLLDLFTSLASVKNDRVLRYFTDDATMTLKISHLEYKLMIARDNQIVREYEVITTLIALIKSLDSKIPRLERASSTISSVDEEVDEEVADAKGFWGFGK